MAGFAVTAALLSLTLRQLGPEHAVRTALAGGLVLLIMAAGELSGIFASLRSLYSNGLTSAAAELALRVTGVAYVAQTAADICRDCGENGLASKAELCGRLMMLTASMPLFLKLALTLIGLAEDLL